MVNKLEDSIDYEPDYFVEAEPFDWDEALEFHKDLLAARKERKLFGNNEKG